MQSKLRASREPRVAPTVHKLPLRAPVTRKYQLEAELESLRTEFRRRLDEKVHAMCCVVDDARARSAHLAVDAVALIITTSHQLSGSAGSYGLHAVGARAAELEAAAKRDHPSLDEIAARLDGLVRVVDDTLRPDAQRDGRP